MTSREKQLAMVNKWLAQNPGESLTSLARRAGLATTTLTRWANNPAHPQQILKSDTFNRIVAVMYGPPQKHTPVDPAPNFDQTLAKVSPQPYFSGPSDTQAFIAQPQTSAPVYQIPRPIAAPTTPLGQPANQYRAVEVAPGVLKNPKGKYIWVDVQSNAMEPSIPQGAFVLVELDVTAQSGSGIYLVAFEELIDLRRLDVDFENIVISADQPGYSKRSISANDTNRLKVLGRAIYAIEQTML